MSDELEREVVPIEYAGVGLAVAYDRGQGDELFRIIGAGANWTTNDDGSATGVYKLTCQPVQGGGDPIAIEVPAGGYATVVYQRGRRPVSLPSH
jgi:hypothetical protein